MIDLIYTYNLSQTIAVDCFTKTFNSMDYMLGFSIFDMYNPLSSTRITEQAFKKLVIKNSLDSFYPTAYVWFTDFGGVYTATSKKAGQYIRIQVSPPKSMLLQSLSVSTIDMVCSIERQNILSYDDDKVEYMLECKFWTARNFGMHINYATPVDALGALKLSPYLIIQNILRKINYPMISLQLPITTARMFYINDEDQTAQDIINYCLQRGCQLGSYPTYLCHNISQNRPMFINRMYPITQRTHAINMSLQIPSKAGANDLDKSLCLKNVKCFTPNTAHQQAQQKALDIGWTYDHLLRKWIPQPLMPTVIDTMLTTSVAQSLTQKSNFMSQTYQQSNIRHYRHNRQHDIYQKMKDLELGTNNIQFDVIGNVIREVGQIIQIDCKRQGITNVFGGFWKIYSIMHIFERNEYINNIIGYRTFDLNSLEDQLGSITG